jgi:hypothetical protein
MQSKEWSYKARAVKFTWGNQEGCSKKGVQTGCLERWLVQTYPTEGRVLTNRRGMKQPGDSGNYEELKPQFSKDTRR